MKFRIKGMKFIPAINNAQIFHEIRTNKPRGILVENNNEVTYIPGDGIGDVKVNYQAPIAECKVTYYANNDMGVSTYTGKKFYLVVPDWRS